MQENKIIIRTFGSVPKRIALYCIDKVIDSVDTWVGKECGFTFTQNNNTIVVVGTKNKNSITFLCYYEQEKRKEML